MFHSKYAVRAALLCALAACTSDVTAPGSAEDAGALLAISDAAHSGAAPGFYFLPPMVQSASFAGTFDGGLQPRVEVCELAGPACGATVATFPFGSGSSSVRVDAAAQHYIANWNTPKSLDPARFYRVQVFVGAFRLGYADVDVVRTGKEKDAVDRAQFVPLIAGQALPVKFRIETGIAAQVVVSPDSAAVPAGGTQQFTAAITDLHGNAIPGAPVAWSSSAPSVATVDGSGLATGVATGQASITATAGAASDAAVLTVFNPNTPPVAQADTFQAIGNVTVPVAAPGLLANDTDGENNPLQAVPGTYPTTGGGSVTVNADGSFSYLSAAGFTGADGFVYTVTDGQDSVSAPATVVSAYRVWYVDNAAAGPGDGRDTSPFTTLAGVEAASASGEAIFVRTGAGAYDGGITLKGTQSLTGQGVPSSVTATLNGQTLVLLAAGSAPVVARTTAGAAVQVAAGNVVQGVEATSSSGAGIAGSGFGSLTVGSVSVSATGGPALDLSAGDVFGSFGALSSSGSAGAGIRLVGVGGSFSAAGGSVTLSAGPGVHVAGGAGTFSYGGDVAVTGPLAVSVTGRTGGTLTLSGAIASTGRGIEVANNSGGGISFTGPSKTLSTGVNGGVLLSNNTGAQVSFGGGGLVVGTTTGVAFQATGGGTVSVTGAGNALATSAGTALRVLDTSTGAAGLTFVSVSAANGTSGIVLENTGRVQVTGSGTPASGGTIQDMSGAGIVLTAASNVFFGHVAVSNTGGSGVGGTGVVNFRFTDGSIQNSGTAGGAGESNLAFNTAAAGTENNLSGTVEISRNVLSGARHHGIDIVNFSGTITDLEIAGNTITSATSAAASLGSGIRLLARGSAAGVANVVRASISGNVVRNFPSGAGILVQGGNGAAAGPAGTFGVPGNASDVIAITGNRISGQPGARMGTSAVAALVNGRGQGNFDISDNGTAADPISHVAGTAIAHSAIGQVNVTSTIARNWIVANNSFASPGISASADRTFDVNDAPQLTVRIDGNVISATDGSGILTTARNSASTVRATVVDNVVAAPLSGVRQGIRVDAGSALGNATVCLNATGNQSAGSGGALGIGLRKQGTNPAVNAFGVTGMAATATPGVEAYVSGQNPSGGGTQLISATSGFSDCAIP